MSKRPTVTVKPREGRRARAGAPWIFSNEIAMEGATKALPPGSVVDVKGDDGQDFGSGFFNPKSLISVRLFARKVGAAADEKFFTGHLARALALRERIYDRPFYRLVHAEGDGLPGLVIDRFGNVLVVQITIAGMEEKLPVLLAALNKLLTPETIILRNDTPSRALEGLESYVRVATGRGKPHRGRREWRALFRRSRPGAEDRLVLRSARQPRFHRQSRKRPHGAGRL